jgi:hypothetical protein
LGDLLRKLKNEEDEEAKKGDRSDRSVRLVGGQSDVGRKMREGLGGEGELDGREPGLASHTDGEN